MANIADIKYLKAIFFSLNKYIIRYQNINFKRFDISYVFLYFYCASYDLRETATPNYNNSS